MLGVCDGDSSATDAELEGGELSIESTGTRPVREVLTVLFVPRVG